MDNCIGHFKNNLTSSSHANFRLDIFQSKMLLYSFGERENGLKADRTCKIFSHLNSCLHNHIFICLHIAYEYIHLMPGTSYLVMNVRVAAQVLSTQSFAKFSNLTASSAITVIFSLIMGELFDICIECQ